MQWVISGGWSKLSTNYESIRIYQCLLITILCVISKLIQIGIQWYLLNKGSEDLSPLPYSYFLGGLLSLPPPDGFPVVLGQPPFPFPILIYGLKFMPTHFAFGPTHPALKQERGFLINTVFFLVATVFIVVGI